MASFEPEVPIRVDPETGIWSTDGLPMIYLPRHFYLNHISAFTKALGEAASARILYQAGYDSAWQWCEKESERHGLRGADVFLHYMKRISQRGWGQFKVVELDRTTGEAEVQLDHSVFVEGYGESSDRELCYGVSGWFSGALEWVGRDLGMNWKLVASERQCAGGRQHDHCVFWIRPSDDPDVYHGSSA
jgi:predicted hydrocarbon binding protein